ncbi:transport-associated ob type 2 [Lucifera butyrica]|uniref:Transport-associated ob type 2 n=1 Tax=Lucifera butyrica TaxID=1351585 RepID=A0A498R8G0_9FIRM|nr:ABC transporter ATP-binding protein [Lucifera butyrica]VBB05428.1 transport-associated ob type 2 [Lucifera butyrica]
MSYLEINGLKKCFKDRIALQDIHLSIAQGEFLTLLGPSGCGKSTLLRILAGFLPCDSGIIRLAGQDIGPLPAHKRDMGFVFQSYALFPNMNVFDNVAFGLKMRRTDTQTIARRVTGILDTVGLADRARHRTQELSGGQQQRVALARALAPRPKILLLDEPLSALDAKIRLSMREFIKSIQRQLKITTIFVTHDQEEALTLSDRIAIMWDGRIIQTGTPDELYHHPNSPFVAQFVGTTNLLPVSCLNTLQGSVPLPVTQAVDQQVRSVSIRPELISLSASCQPGLLPGTIKAKALLGNVIRYTVQIEDTALLVDMLHNPLQTDHFAEGCQVGVDIPASACTFLK